MFPLMRGAARKNKDLPSLSLCIYEHLSGKSHSMKTASFVSLSPTNERDLSLPFDISREKAFPGNSPVKLHRTESGFGASEHRRSSLARYLVGSHWIELALDGHATVDDEVGSGCDACESVELAALFSLWLCIVDSIAASM